MLIYKTFAFTLLNYFLFDQRVIHVRCYLLDMLLLQVLVNLIVGFWIFNTFLNAQLPLGHCAGHKAFGS